MRRVIFIILTSLTLEDCVVWWAGTDPAATSHNGYPLVYNKPSQQVYDAVVRIIAAHYYQIKEERPQEGIVIAQYEGHYRASAEISIRVTQLSETTSRIDVTVRASGPLAPATASGQLRAVLNAISVRLPP